MDLTIRADLSDVVQTLFKALPEEEQALLVRHVLRYTTDAVYKSRGIQPKRKLARAKGQVPSTQAIDSREVAGMVGKRHDSLLRDIRGYVENMRDSTDHKIVVSDFNAEATIETNFGFSEKSLDSAGFFIESTYKDVTGRDLPCYLVTRKGCEFIANKLTGKKGTLFTAAYINRFHEMENQI